MTDTQDIGSLKDGGGRLAELHKALCAKCGHQQPHYFPCNGLEAGQCPCDGESTLSLEGDEDEFVQRHTGRHNGADDDLSSDAAGGSGSDEPAAFGELVALARDMRERIAAIRQLLIIVDAESAELLERSKTWGKL